MTMQGFPYEELFGYQPELAYYSQPGQERYSPRQRRGFGDSYGDFYKRYMGALGGQIRQGQAPTLSFNSYLTQNPFLDYYRNQPQEFRGENPNQFAPRTQWAVLGR